MTRTALVRRVALLAGGACLTAMALLAPPAVAAPRDGGGPHISASAWRQLGAIRADKQSLTTAQRKIDSHLRDAAKAAMQGAFPNGFPHLPTDLPTDPQAQVTVDVSGRLTPALLRTAQAEGATLVTADAAMRSVRLRVPLGHIQSLAASPDVTFIKPALAPLFAAGSVVSEGDATHRALLARTTFGVNGSGVRIGVLSDGVASLAASQASGDLGPVTVLPGQSGPSGANEGTAMLEIVHDLAPGAELFFATAASGPSSFAQNIRDLRAAGCDIIVDDVLYLDESPFQDGPIAQAVNDVTDSGAAYFSSAGNSGNLDDGTSGTWEGDFVPDPVADPYDFADFDPTAAVQTEEPVALVPDTHWATLQWDDPLGRSSNDYNLYLFDASGNLLDSSTTSQTGTQDPFESIKIPGSTKIPNQVVGTAGRYLMIIRESGSARFLDLSLNGGHFAPSGGYAAFATAGATRGHSASAGAFSVAATPARTAAGLGGPWGPYPSAFSTSSVGEPFSSDGPRRMFFAADGTPYTPGDLTSGGGIVRQKPDLTAADGVSTSLSGFRPFFGTSAAAPHAAAIAALLLQVHPGITPAQLRSAMTATAIDLQTAGWDRDTGAGVVDAYGAVQSVAAPAPTVDRLYGSDRYATSAAISGGFAPGVPVALVATGENFPDALAGGAAAGSVGGPVLLVRRDSIPASISEELSRLKPQQIVVAGGPGVVSDQVLAALHAYTAGSVTRVGGANRYATAAALSARYFPTSGISDVLLATGVNYPDALAGSAAAGAAKVPVLLVSPSGIPAETAAELRRLKPATITVLGGAGAVSVAVAKSLTGYASIERRLSGADRYATAVAISQAFFGSADRVVLATGLGFADALSGAARGAALGGPVLLSTSSCVPMVDRAELRRLAASRVTLVGGPGSLSASVAALTSCSG